jgi:hypothetical protein
MAAHFGRDPSQKAEQQEEKQLGRWCNKQREAHKRGELSEDRVRALQNTPGWSWGNNDLWEKRRRSWQNMATQLGRDPSDNSAQPDEKESGTWCRSQRTAHNKGELSEDRVRALQNTPGWSWGRRPKKK